MATNQKNMNMYKVFLFFTIWLEMNESAGARWLAGFNILSTLDCCFNQ